MNVIPAIDLRGGRCVRLLQGDFDQETEYPQDPEQVAANYADLGVDYLHVVDLDGARDGTAGNDRIVARLAAGTSLRIQLGGGLRDETALARWLEDGVNRCVIGSIAVTSPDTVIAWLERFGPERIVAALDVRLDESAIPRLMTHGWRQSTGTSLWSLLDRLVPAGLQHLLCTDIARDGAMSGPNVALYRDIASAYPTLALQASGGVRGIADLTALRNAGASAAICGRALLDGRLLPGEVRQFLRGA
ncbi:MAG: 1-(5-phosphoribosyl)-5-[(5-phosphoribosylamino)methylideneamino]imidazole-4-carboxamide isomerase [Woeseiaceae bacterium]|nr:1-(5-phosphoribosyl)-5-[(5-phosphoribosylamino)methylideneamino]imidazole-4-carboxamide isomerase [Woeseiaceae bacterium]